jgi:O-antigen ligase
VVAITSAQWRAARYIQHALLVALAFGILSFGAVYPWAYWILAPVSAVLAAAAWWTARQAGVGSIGLRAIAVTCVVLLTAILLQLVPLSIATLESISPATVDVLQRLDVRFGMGLLPTHALSLNPELTWTGVALLGAWTVVALGMAFLFSLAGPRRFLQALALLGATVSLIGIVQAPFYAGKVYGFWTPQTQASPFGPFINKNHFGGLMLMLLPAAIGVYLHAMEHAMRGVKAGWRERVLWMASPEASRLLLMAAAIVVMTLGLVLSMARSAMVAAAVMGTLTAIVAARAQQGRRKFIVIAFLVLTAVMSVAWVGLDAQRFLKDGGSGANRLAAWGDGLKIVKAFPLTGTGYNTYTIGALFFQRPGLAHHYAQTHNDYLQLAAEGGALLAIPALVCVLTAAVVVRRRLADDKGTRAYWLRFGAVMGLLSIAAQEFMDFSLQMPANAAVFAVLCGVALHRTPQEMVAASSSRRRHER